MAPVLCLIDDGLLAGSGAFSSPLGERLTGLGEEGGVGEKEASEELHAHTEEAAGTEGGEGLEKARGGLSDTTAEH